MRHPRTAALAAAAAACVVVAGCAIQPPQQDSDQPAGTMLIAADTGSPTFERVYNPFLFNKRTGANYIYEPLLMVNPLNADDTEPWLASSFETPDARTLVMTLRDGVTWSDGEPLTTDDVEYTFDLLQQNPSMDIFGAWQHIDTVSVDGSEITFALQSDDLPAAQQIGQTVIVPQHLWEGLDDPATYTNEEPVGTGPYLLGAYTPQQYEMDKNPDYWQADSVAADRLILPASNTQLDLVSRNYDWAYSFISDVEGTWGAAQQGNTFWFPAGGIVGLIPNVTVAPFDDVDFRQGISHALDRAAIAETASEGYMQPATQTGLLLPNQQDFLDASLPDGGAIAQDETTALEYFAAAGFTQQGGQLVDASGAPVSFTLTTANGFTDWLRGAQEVRRQLGEIGIGVEILSPQPGGYYEAQASGDFELLFGSFGSGNLYQGFNALLSTSYLAPVGETATGNYGRYDNPAAQNLLVQFRSTVDADQQREAVRQLQEIMYTEVPAIGLYYGGLWGLFNDARFSGWPSEADPYTSPQTWDLSPLRILTSLERVGGS